MTLHPPATSCLHCTTTKRNITTDDQGKSQATVSVVVVATKLCHFRSVSRLKEKRSLKINHFAARLMSTASERVPCSHFPCRVVMTRLSQKNALVWFSHVFRRYLALLLSVSQSQKRNKMCEFCVKCRCARAPGQNNQANFKRTGIFYQMTSEEWRHYCRRSTAAQFQRVLS